MDSTHKGIREKLVRTLGDGMDNNLLALTEFSKGTAVMKHSRQLSNSILKSLQPVQPNGPVINLVPKYVPKERKQPKCLIRKPKEPKFIPYEPYKAAVQPILPYSRETKKKITAQKTSKNNIDIQDLVTQMTDMRVAELNKAKIEAITNDDGIISKKQWESEKRSYETDIKNLRETNAHLENQLKFQAQSSNIVDLASANFNFCKNIYKTLVSEDDIKNDIKIEENILDLQYTFGENIASKVMQNTVVLVNKPDSLSNSLIASAMSLTAGQFYVQNPSINASCCAHCKGDVQNI